MEKENKGITLIALIITIIIMLILVGVTVTVALKGGLFSTAKDAVDKTKQAVKDETNLSDYEYEIEMAKAEPSEGLLIDENRVYGRGECNDTKIVITKDLGYDDVNIGGFLGDEVITELVVLSSNAKFDDNAFKDCINLNKILLPKTIDQIYRVTFMNTAYWNDANNWENGILYLGNYLLTGAANGIDKPVDTISGDIKIKEGITMLATESFAGCTDIKSVTIPKSVTKISNGSFAGCTDLASVNYEGTMEEWNNIEFGWEVFAYPTFDDSGEFAGYEYTNATYVQCTDGRVDLPLE